MWTWLTESPPEFVPPRPFLPSRFRLSTTEAVRQSEASRILGQYGDDRKPTIVEPACNGCLELGKFKFLTPKDLVVGQMKFVVMEELKKTNKGVNSLNTRIEFYLDKKTPVLSNRDLMAAVYESHKSADGFLYLKYATWPKPL